MTEMECKFDDWKRLRDNSDNSRWSGLSMQTTVDDALPEIRIPQMMPEQCSIAEKWRK